MIGNVVLARGILIGFVGGWCSGFAPAVLAQDDRQQADPLAQIQHQDPLSCALVGTQVHMCAGPNGAWQVGRLAAAVESLAKALEVAGIGASSDNLQRTIFDDGRRDGFDAALVTPAMSLVDLASSSKSPFGDKTNSVKELAVYSLEALYPGISQGIAPTSNSTGNGFSTFKAFASALSAPGTPRQIGGQDLMGYRPAALSNSEPLLKPFPNLTLGADPASSGIAASDFTMQGTGSIEHLSGSGAFTQLPIAQAFSEFMGHKSGLKSGELLQTPFKGASCAACQEQGGSQIDMPNDFTLVAGQPAGPASSPLTGDGLLNELSSAGIQNDKQEGNGAKPADTVQKPANCYQTCVKDEVAKGAVKQGADLLIAHKGAKDLAIAVVEVNGILGAIGTAEIGFGLYSMKQDKDDTVKGIQACDEKCGGDDKEGDGKGKSGDRSGGGAKSEEQQPSANDSVASTPHPDIGGDTGTPKPGTTPTPPSECDPSQSRGQTYCSNPVYDPKEVMCVSDGDGAVGCRGLNVTAKSFSENGPLYLEVGDDKVRLVKLEGTLEGKLFGDVKQAGRVAVFDESNFSLDSFQPVRSLDQVSANELLRHQNNEFYSSGFESSIPSVDELGLSDSLGRGNIFTFELPPLGAPPVGSDPR
ncbi:hypothetical protein GFM44_23485 [Rhizobium leguminosarum bv. viciae]|nr:hypothetical protein [Rhizobium leguminosarum bv. viciae]